MKFGTLLHAKFHPHRCNVSPLRGEKPQNRPLSKLNTGRFALRAMLPVKISFTTSPENVLLFYMYLMYYRDAVIPVLIGLQQLTATRKCTMLVSGCDDGIMLIYLTLQLLYFHCIRLHHNKPSTSYSAVVAQAAKAV